MQNRVPLYPGRVRMTPVSGQTNVYDMERADQPTQAGTPLNAETLLSDKTAEMYGLSGNNATPDKAFQNIKTEMETLNDSITDIGESVQNAITKDLILSEDTGGSEEKGGKELNFDSVDFSKYSEIEIIIRFGGNYNIGYLSVYFSPSRSTSSSNQQKASYIDSSGNIHTYSVSGGQYITVYDDWDAGQINASININMPICNVSAESSSGRPYISRGASVLFVGDSLSCLGNIALMTGWSGESIKINATYNSSSIAFNNTSIRVYGIRK